MKYLIIVSVAIAVIQGCKTFKKKKAASGDGAINSLGEFPTALYPVPINGKWGYIDSKLQVVIHPRFDYAGDFENGFAVVTMNAGTNDSMKEYEGYIDTAGKVVISCRYDKAYPFSQGLAAVTKDGKYGFTNTRGEEVVPFLYEDASQFSEGLAAVKLNGKNGFIDTTGKMVIAPRFERACWISDFSDGLSAVYTSVDGKGGYIDKSGTIVIPARYDHVGSFSEGRALVQSAENHKYGYINKQGKMIIEPQYDLGLRFSEGLAAVKLSKADGKPVFRIIDTSGRTIADDLHYAFIGIFHDGLAGVESFDHRWGFIDKTGKEVIEPKFAGVKLFRNGLSRMESGSLFKGLKVEYINRQGMVVWQGD